LLLSVAIERTVPYHREFAVRACQRRVQQPFTRDVLGEVSRLSAESITGDHSHIGGDVLVTRAPVVRPEASLAGGCRALVPPCPGDTKRPRQALPGLAEVAGPA